jgi:hypothetical protein
LRLNRQNSAAFESEEWNSVPAAKLASLHVRHIRKACTLSQSDPTDHALAAIASILDHPEVHREPEKTAVEEMLVRAELVEAHGYHKFGPGPMPAIRFKWAVRRGDSGEFFVDETIGENSQPVVSGPMSGDAAVRLVDEREQESQRRFDQLKSEMIGRGAAANLVRKDGGEI